MDKLPELIQKISLNTFEAGSSYWVDITHINNPLSFYVRLTSYRRYLTDVESQGDSINSTELQLKLLVIYKSKMQNKFIRGLLFFIDKIEDSTKCDLFAVDYGFFEKSIDGSEIYKPRISNIPHLAVSCQLADCKPFGGKFTPSAIDAMKSYIGQERARMHVKENGPDTLKVQLFNSCPDDIATMLALTGYTNMGYDGNEVNRFKVPLSEKHYFQYKELKPNDVLHVRMQTGKDLNEFFIADTEDYKFYLKEQDNFTYFCKKLKKLSIDDLEVDKPVSVFQMATNKYERGIVKEVLSDHKARVQLMDWGRIEDVHISLMKPMSEKFFYYPAIAIYCVVEENQRFDNKIQKFLYPGYDFTIKVKEVGNQFNTPYVINLLSI